MIDGGLCSLIQRYLRHWHWQRIETGGTGRGIPDMNGCSDGVEVWIETKVTPGWKVVIRPEQVAWAERRFRAGGRVFLAVRQTGGRRDALWLLSPLAGRRLIVGDKLSDLSEALVLGHWENGPGFWDWPRVEHILLR
jgi:hypothetical protein